MEAPNPIPNEIFLSEIDTSDRIREDYGDLGPMIFSIQELGLIQPLVVTWDENRWKLLAGGRRYKALEKMSRASLKHGKEIVVREELYDSDNPSVKHIRQAIELEENLKRKDLTWQEQVEGKKRLLVLMQERFGVREAGGATKTELSGQATPMQTGFSIRKLSTMLGESQVQTAKDIKLAELLSVIPQLAKVDTKTSALRQVETMMRVVEMKANAKPAAEDKPYTLYRGDVLSNVFKLDSESVDLIYTDLPFGTNITTMSHHTGGIGYADSPDKVISMLKFLLPEAYRILKDNRYAVFFFGFNYYHELLQMLRGGGAGFTVNPIPFIWLKNTRNTEDPNARYGTAYDPALVAMKGQAKFMRPGRANYVMIPPLTNKIQVAQQPVGVPANFILDMTAENAVVADFCAGTGTTGEAAIMHKRFPILFEENNQLCDYIVGRLDSLKP